MSEDILFKKLKRATPGFHWERHEDKLTSGIPDCSYGANQVGGWVELKTYDSWPRHPDSPLRFSDLKPSQVNWAVARGRTQGRVWFLVWVDEDWFLIGWRYARRLGEMTRSELLDASDAWGTKRIPKNIAEVFTRP